MAKRVKVEWFFQAGRILKTDFDVRGHRTLERLLNDRSVPFLIGEHEADDTLRRALLEGRWIYFPGLSAKMPGLRYIHADKTCDRVMAYKNPPGLKPVIPGQGRQDRPL